MQSGKITYFNWFGVMHSAILNKGEMQQLIHDGLILGLKGKVLSKKLQLHASIMLDMALKTVQHEEALRH